MKHSIHLIAFSIFWQFPSYLDLDTGETYNATLDDAIIEKLEHKIRIPRYSRAPIRLRA